ncbi:hypothetical protein TL16_g07353 [Triparma laevis f. inornata]|uniref:Uncharacterized protein n=2 Tax=Triparma laevis TaxID=1534972 RepID=A0A9W7CEV0_9STRA|nr:hypothetical protein TL16_g07353 [Triparma laevis f. inornata]GMI08657.1 hypothetical protein TrLO_g12651 [Triparma laevis f. longispina]
MFTPEFRSHFIEFVPGDTLMTLRLVTNGWKAAADVFINVGVKSGEIIVHSGNDLDWRIYSGGIRALITRVIFSLNATKVGEYICKFADNLVIVDIPDITSIGLHAFTCCMSLTAVYLPTTLTSIGNYTFNLCTSLENFDLLHTNLQELGEMAVAGCLEIKSMTIPDSLRTLGYRVFDGCVKLVPSNINTQYNDAVVAHLRSLQN